MPRAKTTNDSPAPPAAPKVGDSGQFESINDDCRREKGSVGGAKKPYKTRGFSGFDKVEPKGVEPSTSALRTHQSDNKKTIENTDENADSHTSILSVAPDVAPTSDNHSRDWQNAGPIADLIDAAQGLDSNAVETLLSVARGLLARAMIENPKDANAGNR